jgi:hypothetical protein
VAGTGAGEWMSEVRPWHTYYQALPDGRFLITRAALTAVSIMDESRVLDTTLSGRSARVLLLDRPFQLGLKAENVEVDSFYLGRIRLRELPGWPPRILPASEVRKLPPLIDLKLKASRFKRAGSDGQEGIEFDLDHAGGVYKAWQIGGPLQLLRCELATLAQKGVAGSKLIDIQEMRLVGSD